MAAVLEESLSLYATKLLLEQVKSKEANERRSILPSFCLRGEAAIEILTGVQFQSGEGDFGSYEIRCYSVEADAPRADSFLIYDTLKNLSIQPPGEKGLWGFHGTSDGKDFTRSIFLFRRVDYAGGHHTTIPVKMTLIGDYERGLLHLINPMYLPQPMSDRSNTTWTTCTFKPRHLKFRVYSPTLLLIDLLLRRPEEYPEPVEHSTHLIMLLMEKGFQPAAKRDGDEGASERSRDAVLDAFSPSSCHKVLTLLKPEILEQAEKSAQNLKSTFAPVCANALKYRTKNQLDGTLDAHVMKDLLKVLLRIFKAYRAADKVRRDERARAERATAAHQAHYSRPASYNTQVPAYPYGVPPHVPPHPQNPYYAYPRPQPEHPQHDYSSPRFGMNSGRDSRTW